MMPIIGLMTGGIDFSNLYLQLSGAPAPTLAAARQAGATIAYGNFITLLINFLIIAWVLFMVVKAMNTFKKKEMAADPAPAKEILVLTEIRDLLAKDRSK